MDRPITLEDLSQEPIGITGVILRTEGDRVQVLLQIDLQWHLILSQPAGCREILVTSSWIRSRSDPIVRELCRPGALKARYLRDPDRPREG